MNADSAPWGPDSPGFAYGFNQDGSPWNPDGSDDPFNYPPYKTFDPSMFTPFNWKQQMLFSNPKSH